MKPGAAGSNGHPAPSISQPAYIKLINRLGKHLAEAGFARPGLNVDRLLVQATKRTGLQDFGDESFRAGLKMLTAELQTQAQLSQIGRMAAHFNLLDQLCVRLQLTDIRARRSEIVEQKIRKPLFITGLPRTGTTILYELLAQDPAVRSPASWETAKPMPPPKNDCYDIDKRIAPVDRILSLAEKLSPGLKSIHAIGARLPQECVYILASHFASEQFSYMYDIPQYRSWALEQDMTAAYRWHHDFLQHLQVDCYRERWVLKAPSHLAHLKYVLAQYPDAAIVWTHRRPLDAMASFSSLAYTLRSGFSDNVELAALGVQELGYFSKVVGAGMEQRRGLNQGQFLDVCFSDICTDPLSVVSDIYNYFGIHFSPQAENRMRQYLQRRPRNLYGKHQYSCEKFGLDDAQEQEQYAEYMASYGDFLH